MPHKIPFASAVVLSLGLALSAQSAQLYPHAITDRLVHPETPMSPPARNVVFTDPDFGSSMVRATDETTDFKSPGSYSMSDGSGEANEWSVDSRKFYVSGDGRHNLAFAFDPATMSISSLPNATPGQGLLLPLRPGATFSSVNPDLIYGTADPNTLTITSYRFSTGMSTPVIDTTTCGVEPPLVAGPSTVSDDDVRTSLNDNRFSISEGGKASGAHMFVVIYDRHLGCRWYNTQTGQIGGQWGNTGTASVTSPYLIRHAYLSRSGKYALIMVGGFGWYVWDVSTLNVTPCSTYGSRYECAGYLTVGYNSVVNGPAVAGDMQVAMRPLGSLSQITQLVEPVPDDWGQVQHFTWGNASRQDKAPVCGSTYTYDGDYEIEQPFAQEIFCAETDGLGSTVWRFAHNRASWVTPYYSTQPLGTVSQDGRFFIFSSDWEGQLGTGPDGRPRSDVFILKLD